MFGNTLPFYFDGSNFYCFGREDAPRNWAREANPIRLKDVYPPISVFSQPWPGSCVQAWCLHCCSFSFCIGGLHGAGDIKKFAWAFSKKSTFVVCLFLNYLPVPSVRWHLPSQPYSLSMRNVHSVDAHLTISLYTSDPLSKK